MTEIVPLTSIRGVAAFWVMWFHFNWALTERRLETFLPVGPGGLGVDLFFVLSGFILALNHPKLGPRSARTFLLRRFARVYPLHIFALLLLGCFVGAAAALGRSPNPAAYNARDLLLAVVMLQPFGSTATWNFPSWSVQVEAALYCLLPLLIPFVRSLNRHVQLTLFIAASVGLVPLAYAISDRALWTVYAVAFVEMTSGVLILFLSAHLSRGRVLQYFGIAGVIGSIVADRPLMAIPFFAPLIAGLCDEAGWISRFLSIKPLHFLGTISYSIYLLQIPVLILCNALFAIEKYAASMHGQLIYAVFYATAIILVSAASYRWVETPARKYLMRRFRERALA